MARAVLHGGAVFRKNDDGHAGAAFERLLQEDTHGGLDFAIFVQRGLAIADHLFHGGQVADFKTIRAHSADEKGFVHEGEFGSFTAASCPQRPGGGFGAVDDWFQIAATALYLHI